MDTLQYVQREERGKFCAPAWKLHVPFFFYKTRLLPWSVSEEVNDWRVNEFTLMSMIYVKRACAPFILPHVFVSRSESIL